MIAIPFYGSESVFELCDDASIILAEFYDFEDTGYGTLTIEQWGTDPNIKQIVVSGEYRNALDTHDIDENFEVDMTDKAKFEEAYEKAAELYNCFCPVNKKIPVIWDELKL